MDRIMKTSPVLLEIIDYLDIPSLLSFRASCKAPYLIIDEYRHSILNGLARHDIPFRVMKYAPVERYPQYYRFEASPPSENDKPGTVSSTHNESKTPSLSTRRGEDLVILHPAGLYILWRRYLTAKMLSRCIPFIISDSVGWGVNAWDPFAFPLHLRLEEGFLVAFYFSDVSKISYARTRSSIPSSSTPDPFSPPTPQKRLSTWTSLKQHVNHFIDSSTPIDHDKYNHPPSTAEAEAQIARNSAATEEISEQQRSLYHFATKLSLICLPRHDRIRYGQTEDVKYDYIQYKRDPATGTSWLNWLILTEGPFLLASLIGVCDGYVGEEEWFEPGKEIKDVRNFVRKKFDERDNNRIAMERNSHKAFQREIKNSDREYTIWFDDFRGAIDKEQRMRKLGGEKFEDAMDQMEEIAKGEWKRLGHCEWEEADERYLKLQRTWFDAQVEVVKKKRARTS